MFENKLYTLVGLVHEGSKVKSWIHLNPEHEIFKGHFPEKPILPGVCTLQIIKEICEKSTHQTLILAKGDNLKFTSLIVPDACKNLLVEIDIISFIEKDLKISVLLSHETEVLFKMKANYTCQ